MTQHAGDGVAFVPDRQYRHDPERVQLTPSLAKVSPGVMSIVRVPLASVICRRPRVMF
jgi:hypothetical protein